MRAIIATAFTLLLIHGADAQTQAAPQFEVAVIKPAAPMPAGIMKVGGGGGPGTGDPGKVSYVNMSLRELLSVAFSVKRDQINGPDVLDSARFDLTAKVPSGVTKEQLPGMMRKLLEERFHLVAHTETRQLPVYVLTIAKGGLKMKVANPDAAANTAPRLPGVMPPLDKDGKPVLRPGGTMMFMTNGRMSMSGSAMDITRMSDMLTNYAGRPIIDKTGLKDKTDKYDFTLTFAPDPGSMRSAGGLPMPPGGGGGDGGGTFNSRPADGLLAGSDEPAPGLFTALQDQLGLKLDSDKGPVETVIVDRIDKSPVDN